MDLKKTLTHLDVNLGDLCNFAGASGVGPRKVSDNN